MTPKILVQATNIEPVAVTASFFLVLDLLDCDESIFSHCLSEDRSHYSWIPPAGRHVVLLHREGHRGEMHKEMERPEDTKYRNNNI